MVTLPERPGIQPPGPWRFPRGEERVLPNGVRIIGHHLPGQYVVSMGLLLDLPVSAEPRDREGVALLTAQTLTQGTHRRPGPAFGGEVESLGAVLEATSGYSHLHAIVDVPGTTASPAVRLLAEATITPALSDGDVSRQGRRQLAAIEQRLATGAGRANHALRRALVDPASRTSRMVSGEPDTLARVTGADVRAHHGAHIGPRGATLVISGDLPSDVLDAAEDAFGSWSAPDQAEVTHEVPRMRAPGAYLIDRPGAVQADIRVGWPTIDRTDPRWAPLQLATHALGGAYLSRLNRVLREEKGFTYGASLVNVPLRTGGYSTAQGSFRNEVVAEVLSLVPSLMDVAAAPITGDELDRARDFLVGTSPLRYGTASGVTHGVLALLGAGLGPEHVDRVLQEYSRTTPDEATQAAAALLDPAASTLVVVGDAGVLAPQLGSIGWDVQVVPPGEWI